MLNKVKMMTKKPGPPVPPRPHNTSNFMKSFNESCSTIPPSIAARSTNKVSTTTASASASPASSEAGRTVIYKSPSFDLKKRQEDQQKRLQNQQDQSCVKPQQQQQQIFISDHQNESIDKIDKNVVTIENNNRNGIVIINSNNENKNITKQNNKNSSSNCNKIDNEHLLKSRQIIERNNNKNGETITSAEDHPSTTLKISPIPKPRTLILAKQPKSLSFDKSPSPPPPSSSAPTPTVTKIRSESVTINNNPETIAIKNIEVENNLKNAAERLFTEIIINQSKPSFNNKTEHCISVRESPTRSIYQNMNPVVSDRLHTHRRQQPPPAPPIRTCVNLSQRPEPEGGETDHSGRTTIDNGLAQDSSKPAMGSEKKVAFHEILISELTAMRKSSIDHDSDDHDPIDQIDMMKEKQDNNDVQKPQRKRYPSGCSTDSSPYGTQRSARIRTSDWVEVGDNGKEVMLTSCHISLEDSGMEDEERLDDMSSGVGDSWDSVKDAEERMSLPGLPPLPKSLSGLELTGVPVHNSTTGSLASLESQRGISPLSRMTATQGGTTTTTSTLDTQLAVLRREMFGLRQLDLSLLSQLWALNESIQEFRTMLQEQETLSPPSPSPSPSEANSVSSGDEDDISSIGKSQLPAALQRMRSAPPPPPPTRMAPQRPV